jgi:hypothetical protein
MLLMNRLAYAPLHKLLLVLEDRGFAQRRDRPTVQKVRVVGRVCTARMSRAACRRLQGLLLWTRSQVVRVYISEPLLAAHTDLRSRPLKESAKKYLAGV